MVLVPSAKQSTSTSKVSAGGFARKKEKTLGPASIPKHEAQQKLTEYIEEYTGRIVKQGDAITTFADLWNAYCAVRSGQWAKKTKEDLRYPCCETFYSDHRKPTAARNHSDIATIAP
jgi:hypothetical protein